MWPDKRKLKTIILLIIFSIINIQTIRADEEIIVSAAASLTGVMKKIWRSYEAATPSASLVFNFASSGSLLQQIKLGAPVDVYLSASTEFMDRAEKDKLILKETRQNFAMGRLVIIAPTGSRRSVKDINDMLSSGILKIAIGNPKTVPAGRYAKAALIHAGLWRKIEGKLIFANSVRQVLDYTTRNEVDAGFVYATDVMSTSRVKTVSDVKNTGQIIYPVAVTAATKHKKASTRFITFLRSEKGQALLIAAGFNRPEERKQK